MGVRGSRFGLNLFRTREDQDVGCGGFGDKIAGERRAGGVQLVGVVTLDVQLRPAFAGGGALHGFPAVKVQGVVRALNPE